MDGRGIEWYFSRMIPVFTLYGETSAFPDVIHCERVLDRARLHDWVITPHRHGQMSQILRIETGAAQARVDGLSLMLGAEEYLYIPAQAVHGFAFSQGAEGSVLSFPSAVLSGMTPEIQPWLGAVQHGRVPDPAGAMIAQLHQAHAGAGIFRAQRLVALAHLLLAALAEDSLAQRPPDRAAGRQVQRLEVLIAGNLGRGWTARDYAAALNVSTSHLNRIVRAAKGHSLTAHLEAATMAEACRLIAFTRMPVAEIGYRLGFGDPSYFSRRFRRRMGEAPSDYRLRFQHDQDRTRRSPC